MTSLLAAYASSDEGTPPPPASRPSASTSAAPAVPDDDDDDDNDGELEQRARADAFNFGGLPGASSSAASGSLVRRDVVGAAPEVLSEVRCLELSWVSDETDGADGSTGRSPHLPPLPPSQDFNNQTSLITRPTDKVMNVNIPYADVRPSRCRLFSSACRAVGGPREVARRLSSQGLAM